MITDVIEDIAQFLLVRQEYAFMGYSWMGCIQPDGFGALRSFNIFPSSYLEFRTVNQDGEL